MATEDTRQISLVPFQGQKRRALQKLVAGSDSKEEQRIGYIYMVRTREFKLLGRNVYKIGKTTQEADTRIRRLTEYTRGSEVYVVEELSAELVGIAEDRILEECRRRWNAGPDGNEYFEIPEGRRGIMDAREIIHRIVMELNRGVI
jgi:hypothetical protein